LVPSKFPRAGRDLIEETSPCDDDDAPSRSYFWESSTVKVMPGVTRLSSSRISTKRIGEPMPPFDGDFAEGTNPPRAPITRAESAKRSTTRDDTAPLD
jgi:hypothetical protein